MIPAACAAPRAAQIWSVISTASPRASGPWRRRASSDMPSTLLERDGEQPVLFDEVEELDDVLAVEPREDRRLAVEALVDLRIAAEVPVDHLEATLSLAGVSSTESSSLAEGAGGRSRRAR